MLRLRRRSRFAGSVLLTTLLLGLGQTPNASAGPLKEPQGEWAVDRSLALTPRAEPMPALRYRLLPLASDRKEGNAVPIYLRLVHERNDETKRQWRDKPAAWNQLPLEQLPVAEARKWLNQYAYMMKQLDLGARRKSAEWNYTLDAGDPIGILLPDAQTMRYYGAMLVLRARLELAEGDYAAAAYTLETGFAFSRHIVEGPFLINGLVGIAIASQMSDVLLDWVGRPDAPNLYWSLTALPRPLIDLRAGYEVEYRMLEMQFPDLADIQRERSPADWDAALRHYRTDLARILGLEKERRSSLPGRAPTEPAANSPELPAARKFLVEHMQIPAARVDTMPPAQVLMFHIVGVYGEFRDDVFKGTYLPAEQAFAVLQAADARLKAAPDTEATRLPRVFMPAVAKVMVATNRLDRRIAALRAIEAIRLHAAAHDGRLPDQLADVSVVPVPLDPGTGRPFEYRLDHETATLTAPPVPAGIPKTGLRYRLSMKRSG
jgi:hypothetical protein